MSESMPADVVERLRERATRGEFPSVLVLPSAVRDGAAYYSEFDIDAVKNAADAGVDAEFLDPAENRRYFSEYSAGVLLALMISVMQDLTVDGLKVVGSFFLAQIRRAVTVGLIKDSDEPDLRIDVASIRLRPDEVQVDNLHVEARGEQAIAALLPLLGGRAAATAALQQLGLPTETLKLSQSDQSETE